MEYIVYHNPDTMGRDASQITEAFALTNKPAPAGLIGSRIWLLTGAGKPRRFFIRACFTAAEVISGENEGFRTKVVGTAATFFTPMAPIPPSTELTEFRRSQGNFAFGLQPIHEPRFLTLLQSAVADRT